MVSGQSFVQPLPSVQVILPPFSDVSRYRVRPCPFTRTVPTPGTFVALTVAAAEDVPAELALELPELGLDPEPDPVVADDPQAATVMAAPRTRLPPSSR